MKLYTVVVFVIALAAVNCYHEEDDEHFREVRHTGSRFSPSRPSNQGPYTSRHNPNIPIPVSGVSHLRPKRQNNVSVGAGHTRGQGSHVNVEAQRRLWTSNNGRSQVDAHGHYQQNFGGPRNRDYGAGVRFQHRF